MPPRSRSGSPEHLTAENLETLAAALAEGKRATVYLREAMPSLGIEAGCSAKVVSVEGNTVLIRPKGVDDELPFEAEELRMTRKAPEPATPARKTTAPKPAPAPKPATATAVTPVAPAAAKPAAPTVSAPRVQAQAQTPATPAQAQAPATPAPAQAPATQTPAQAPATQTPAPRRPRKPQGGVSVTIHAGAENEWTVTVAHGAKRSSKAVPVSPDAVDRAMRELGDPGALEAVQSVISAAREAAEQRVAALAKELEDARRALEALG